MNQERADSLWRDMLRKRFIAEWSEVKDLVISSASTMLADVPIADHRHYMKPVFEAWVSGSIDHKQLMSILLGVVPYTDLEVWVGRNNNKTSGCPVHTTDTPVDGIV